MGCPFKVETWTKTCGPYPGGFSFDPYPYSYIYIYYVRGLVLFSGTSGTPQFNPILMTRVCFHFRAIVLAQVLIFAISNLGRPQTLLKVYFLVADIRTPDHSTNHQTKEKNPKLNGKEPPSNPSLPSKEGHARVHPLSLSHRRKSLATETAAAPAMDINLSLFKGHPLVWWL